MSHFHQPLGRTRSTCCQMPSLDKFFNVRTCCSVHTRHLIQCFPEFINYRDKNNTYIIKQASEYSHSWENISLEIRIQLLQNWWKLVESSLQLRCYTCLGPEKYIASIRTVSRTLLQVADSVRYGLQSRARPLPSKRRLVKALQSYRSIFNIMINLIRSKNIATSPSKE